VNLKSNQKSAIFRMFNGVFVSFVI
jgi:hypothetical protein